MTETTTAEVLPIYLTAKQLAARWNISLNALYTNRSKGRPFPPGSRIGKKLHFPLAGVLEHERKHQMADRSFNPSLDEANAPVERKAS
jgi:hypothetical protein